MANDAGGWRCLQRKLAGVALVVVEATSKYHRAVHRRLHAASIPVAIVNPLRARLFAEASGTLAKTDAIDAKMLATMAATLIPDITPPPAEAVEALQEIARARHAAVAERVALGHRYTAAATAFLRAELTTRLRACTAHIARLEAEIARRIAADPIMARRQAILRSIPGIGPVAATALITDLDALGQLTAKQAAALAGLAPFAHDSGARQGNRRIRGGRPDLRCALYMAALSASRHNPDLTGFAQRLRDNGKPAKVALIAIAHKLIVLANTLVAQNRTWTPIRT